LFGAGLLALLLAGAGVLWLCLDRLAASALVAGVESSCDTRCAVGGMSVSLLSSQVSVDDMIIRNPRGFSANVDLFRIGQARLALQMGSIWSEPIRVQTLEIDHPVVCIETGQGGTNLQAFLEGVSRIQSAPSSGSGGEKRMTVHKLIVRDAVIRLGAGLTGKGLVNIGLDRLEIQNIRGKNGAGITTGELAAMVVMELSRRGALAGNISFHNLIPVQLMRAMQALLLTSVGPPIAVFSDPGPCPVLNPALPEALTQPFNVVIRLLGNAKEATGVQGELADR
jgi:hypothetical protein